MKRSTVVTCVVVYLVVAVVANVIVSMFGRWMLPLTAFALIPFELTSRDLLHNQWERGGRLWSRIALLVLSGSALSFLFASPAVCFASAIAFGSAAVADSVAYAFLRGQPTAQRMNGSNMVSALVDSFVFPLVAFGVFDFDVFMFQAIAKIVGGGVWVWALSRLSPWHKPRRVIG